MTTSSVLEVQGVVMVHLSVYPVPTTPVKLLVGLVGVVIVPPAPEIKVQEAVPDKAVFAASVVDDVPITVWSGPAFETVGCGTQIPAFNSYQLPFL